MNDKDQFPPKSVGHALTAVEGLKTGWDSLTEQERNELCKQAINELQNTREYIVELESSDD